jgi:DNA-binding transcriptional regulator GbsR (MarR family)
VIAMSNDLNYSLTNADEFEEINSEEVDRVVEALDRLIEGVQSENIKHYLEEAASNIYYLIYEEEENLVDDEDTFDRAA